RAQQELAGAAAEIEDRRRSVWAERGEHGVVHGAIRRPLHERMVVDARPGVEEPAPRSPHRAGYFAAISAMRGRAKRRASPSRAMRSADASAGDAPTKRRRSSATASGGVPMRDVHASKSMPEPSS